MTSLALDLFEDLAWKRGGEGEEIPKKIADAAERARAMLKDFAKGAAVLTGAAFADAPGGSGEAIAVVSGDEPMFTKEKMSGF